MYEEIVNYFEKNLCIENIYFRKKAKLWIPGIIVALLIEITINYIIFKLANNIKIKIISCLFLDFLITIVTVYLIYFLPISKMYKRKMKKELKLDLIGELMKKEKLSTYRKFEIKKMKEFMMKECKIKNKESIDIIIRIINDELKDKYANKKFIDIFNRTVWPVAAVILTILFDHIQEQNLINILIMIVIPIILIFIIGDCITKIKNNSIPISIKRENLLELKRVLMDIEIEWNN